MQGGVQTVSVRTNWATKSILYLVRRRKGLAVAWQGRVPLGQLLGIRAPQNMFLAWNPFLEY